MRSLAESARRLSKSDATKSSTTSVARVRMALPSEYCLLGESMAITVIPMCVQPVRDLATACGAVTTDHRQTMQMPR